MYDNGVNVIVKEITIFWIASLPSTLKWLVHHFLEIS